MRAIIHNVRLTHIKGVVPPGISHFDDEVSGYTQDIESSAKLKKLMGYGTHRIAQNGETVSDLAHFGIRELVTGGALDLDSIGALVLVTQTPDYVLPATSSYLHGKLGLAEETYCVDINDGCTGYIKGLHAVTSLFSASDIQRAILVTGDVLSRRVSKKDRNSYPLIGDAVTVSVVERDAGAKPIYFDLRNDGRGYDRIIIPAGGARQAATPDSFVSHADPEGNERSEMDLRMQGRDVFTFTQTVVPAFLDNFFEWAGHQPDSLEKLYLHQANAFIIDRIRRRFGLTGSVVPDTVIRQYGNSSAATIPMAIASDNNARPAKCVLGGFGVGLSWGAASIDLSNLSSADVSTFGDTK